MRDIYRRKIEKKYACFFFSTLVRFLSQEKADLNVLSTVKEQVSWLLGVGLK